MKIRAAERNFQLLVGTASDINTQMILNSGGRSPDAYRQSFELMAKSGIIPADLAKELSLSAGLRNILVHEYDFDTDYQKFFESAKRFLPAYENYLIIIFQHEKKQFRRENA